MTTVASASRRLRVSPRRGTVTTHSRPASPPRPAGGTSTGRHGEVQPTGLSTVCTVGSLRHSATAGALRHSAWPPGGAPIPGGGCVTPVPTVVARGAGRARGGGAPRPGAAGSGVRTNLSVWGPGADRHRPLPSMYHRKPHFKKDRRPAGSGRGLFCLDGVGGISTVTGNDAIHTIQRRRQYASPLREVPPRGRLYHLSSGVVTSAAHAVRYALVIGTPAPPTLPNCATAAKDYIRSRKNLVRQLLHHSY